MYNWKLRLSKRIDIYIVFSFWAVSIFNIITNFIVYSVFSQYDLNGYYKGGNIEGGFLKALNTALFLIPICIIITILMLGDRYLAGKEAKFQERDKSEFDVPSLEFRKRNLLRLIIFGIIIFISLPWILALVGIYASDIPGLSAIFLGRQPYPDMYGYPSVHLGVHHGWDAYLFAVMAIIASISLDSRYYLKNNKIRSIVAGGIAFFILYTVIAGTEDFLNEQIIKRGIETPIYYFFNALYTSPFRYPVTGIIAVLFALFWYYYFSKSE